MRLIICVIWGWVTGATLLPAAAEAASVEASTEGQAIYEAMCVRCHGADGQGAEGQQDAALGAGDWSVERLARRIHRTMPEDDPEQCEGEEAQTVANYVYEAFYSPGAQARNRPARVELVRLTDRQYEHTLADLLGQFRGDPERPGTERGLRATYYRHKDFRKDSQLEPRLEPTIDFHAEASDWYREHRGTNGFSAQWRGSVFVEETGDCEFVLKTPNGARLWVNQEDEPLIDAWVASGSQEEHRATLRLLGGRHYALRLDWFQYQETNAAVVLEWKPPQGVQEVLPARNLFPTRALPTFVLTTPFPPDDSSVGYARGVSISKAWDEAATFAAIEVANYVVDQLNALSRSKATDSNRQERLEEFCRTFVSRAFRRPLTSAEEPAYVDAFFQNAGTPEEAVKRVVLRTLKSPRFLYLGLEDGDPDDFTLAARLSFELWDSLPDRELWKAAEQGRLETRDAVRGQAQRMLKDSRTQAKILNSLHHWLQVNQVESLAKDPELFPEFTPEIAADLRTSLNLFLQQVVWGEASDYRELLLADYCFVSPRLAEFYGLEVPPGGDFSKMTMEGSHRSGVLTHPYLLAAFAYPRSTSPIHRGVFLTRNIVGRALNPPPMAVAFKDAEFDPHLTMRQKVEELTRPQACQSCHSFINPLGFSLEQFDAVGRFRTRDQDRPIDTASDYTTEDGQTLRLTGARDVAEFAAHSPDAQRAFIELLFHQVVKQPMQAYGADVMGALHARFTDSDFNIQAVLVEIATLSALYAVEPVTVSTLKP